ncbi:hypothetical protein PPERSA_10988 [Pseudocohnilembus persalinus]|uniref:Uncharacterized protein n=1 Tax=Pseudocohnilembus persalinus TaxID=266149 RepID=A0A0V0QCA0_PSEPJ|nr:hypothetical protein PPERSA_10988 [Pseudocohnilembus persalinus]|eukprot:KRW99869.1 hypothetical protein PPERSA_10988 [Pseudocohnilembus persalinus]
MFTSKQKFILPPLHEPTQQNDLNKSNSSSHKSSQNLNESDSDTIPDNDIGYKDDFIMTEKMQNNIKNQEIIKYIQKIGFKILKTLQSQNYFQVLQVIHKMTKEIYSVKIFNNEQEYFQEKQTMENIHTIETQKNINLSDYYTKLVDFQDEAMILIFEELFQLGKTIQLLMTQHANAHTEEKIKNIENDQIQQIYLQETIINNSEKAIIESLKHLKQYFPLTIIDFLEASLLNQNYSQSIQKMDSILSKTQILIQQNHFHSSFTVKDSSQLIHKFFKNALQIPDKIIQKLTQEKFQEEFQTFLQLDEFLLLTQFVKSVQALNPNVDLFQSPKIVNKYLFVLEQLGLDSEKKNVVDQIKTLDIKQYYKFGQNHKNPTFTIEQEFAKKEQIVYYYKIKLRAKLTKNPEKLLKKVEEIYGYNSLIYYEFCILQCQLQQNEQKYPNIFHYQPKNHEIIKEFIEENEEIFTNAPQTLSNLKELITTSAANETDPYQARKSIMAQKKSMIQRKSILQRQLTKNQLSQQHNLLSSSQKSKETNSHLKNPISQNKNQNQMNTSKSSQMSKSNLSQMLQSQSKQNQKKNSATQLQQQIQQMQQQQQSQYQSEQQSQINIENMSQQQKYEYYTQQNLLKQQEEAWSQKLFYLRSLGILYSSHEFLPELNSNSSLNSNQDLGQKSNNNDINTNKNDNNGNNSIDNKLQPLKQIENYQELIKINIKDLKSLYKTFVQQKKTRMLLFDQIIQKMAYYYIKASFDPKLQEQKDKNLKKALFYCENVYYAFRNSFGHSNFETINMRKTLYALYKSFQDQKVFQILDKIILQQHKNPHLFTEEVKQILSKNTNNLTYIKTYQFFNQFSFPTPQEKNYYHNELRTLFQAQKIPQKLSSQYFNRWIYFAKQEEKRQNLNKYLQNLQILHNLIFPQPQPQPKSQKPDLPLENNFLQQKFAEYMQILPQISENQVPQITRAQIQFTYLPQLIKITQQKINFNRSFLKNQTQIQLQISQNFDQTEFTDQILQNLAQIDEILNEIQKKIQQLSEIKQQIGFIQVNQNPMNFYYPNLPSEYIDQFYQTELENSLNIISSEKSYYHIILLNYYLKQEQYQEIVDFCAKEFFTVDKKNQKQLKFDEHNQELVTVYLILALAFLNLNRHLNFMELIQIIFPQIQKTQNLPQMLLLKQLIKQFPQVIENENLNIKKYLLDVQESFQKLNKDELQDEETLKFHFFNNYKKMILISKRDISGQESLEYFKYKIFLNLQKQNYLEIKRNQIQFQQFYKRKISQQTFPNTVMAQKWQQDLQYLNEYSQKSLKQIQNSLQDQQLAFLQKKLFQETNEQKQADLNLQIGLIYENKKEFQQAQKHLKISETISQKFPPLKTQNTPQQNFSLNFINHNSQLKILKNNQNSCSLSSSFHSQISLKKISQNPSTHFTNTRYQKNYPNNSNFNLKTKNKLKNNLNNSNNNLNNNSNSIHIQNQSQTEKDEHNNNKFMSRSQSCYKLHKSQPQLALNRIYEKILINQISNVKFREIQQKQHKNSFLPKIHNQ